MVQIEAQLYNESYELINEPDVSIILKNQNGEEFPQAFNKTSNAYILKTDKLPVGNYSYTASTVWQGKKYNAGGAFTIQPLQLENMETTSQPSGIETAFRKNRRTVFLSE